MLVIAVSQKRSGRFGVWNSPPNSQNATTTFIFGRFQRARRRVAYASQDEEGLPGSGNRIADGERVVCHL